MNHQITRVALGVAWAVLLAVNTVWIPINLPEPFNITLGIFLGTITIIFSLRGAVLFNAMRAGRAIEREATGVPSRPRRVA